MSAKQLQLNGVGTHDAAWRVGHAAYASLIERRKEDAAFKLTEDALIEAIRPALAAEIPKRAKVNGRDELFDAIAIGFGCSGKVTRAMAGSIAKSLKEIREVDPGVTPDDLARGCAFVRRRYENCGPMSLSSNWHLIAKRKIERTATSLTDIYQEPPVEWRETAKKLYPKSLNWITPHDFSTISWFDVSTVIRPEILKAIHETNHT